MCDRTRRRTGDANINRTYLSSAKCFRSVGVLYSKDHGQQRQGHGMECGKSRHDDSLWDRECDEIRATIRYYAEISAVCPTLVARMRRGGKGHIGIAQNDRNKTTMGPLDPTNSG